MATIEISLAPFSDEVITSMKIYRNTSVFSESSSTLLDTVSGSATSYTDNSVTEEQTYYYIIVVEKDDGTTFKTEPTPIKALKPYEAPPPDVTIPIPKITISDDGIITSTSISEIGTHLNTDWVVTSNDSNDVAASIEDDINLSSFQYPIPGSFSISAVARYKGSDGATEWSEPVSKEVIILDEGTKVVYAGERGVQLGTLIKYKPDGTREWVDTYGAHEVDNIVVGDDGFIYFNSQAIIKIHPNGTIIWSDDTYKIRQIVLRDGLLYASVLDMPGFVVYDLDGNFQWEYNGEVAYTEYAERITVDSQGNVYVTLHDHIHKVNSSGTLVWDYVDETFNTLVNLIAIDSEDYIYYTQGKHAVKMDTDKSVIWDHSMDNQSRVLFIDMEDSIYITDKDIEKRDSDGELLQSYTIMDSISDMVVSEDGFFYISSYDDYIICRDEEGTQIWKDLRDGEMNSVAIGKEYYGQ